MVRIFLVKLDEKQLIKVDNVKLDDPERFPLDTTGAALGLHVKLRFYVDLDENCFDLAIDQVRFSDLPSCE